MAGSAGGAQSRVLRACIFLSGRVVDDRRLKSSESLSLGSRANNTVTIREANLPESHTLFRPKGDGYELVVSGKMSGTVSIDGDSAPVDIESLKQQGLLQKSGNEFVMTLSSKHRGTIVIDDVSVIFQFVTPPPVPPKPKLPASARGTLAQQIDWNFAAILIVSFIFHFGGIGYVNTLPTPPKETSIDTIDERWAALIVPEKKPKPKEPKKPKDKPKDDKKDDSKSKEKVAEKKEDKPIEKPTAKPKPVRSKQQRDQIAKSLENKGILAVLGAVGGDSAGGAIADVLGEGSVGGGDLDAAFEGIAGVGVATDANQRTKRGGASGEAATIGGLKTQGGGKVKKAKKEKRLVGKAKFGDLDVDGSLDSGSIAKVVQKRMKSIQGCYNKELKRDPSLKGKVEIEFTIGENGRIEEALTVGNTMGNKTVANCILRMLNRWKFPKPDGGSVTVVFPFIFSS